MSTIWMVRHGEAAAGYGTHPDPGLSERGRRQAMAVAATLTGPDRPTPRSIVSSPMLRARETAQPLADQLGRPVTIEPAVSEIPSPGLAPAERGPWLRRIMTGTWDDAGAAVRAWRDGIAAAVAAAADHTVFFSHYVAINAAISVATAAAGPYCRSLDHCSVTAFDTGDGRLSLVEAGDEGQTLIL